MNEQNEDIRNQPLWVIYKWHFIESNSVYIGLTRHYKNRISSELCQGTVYEHIQRTNDSYNVGIVLEGLTASEAAEAERAYIAEALTSGATVLNKNAGGGLGPNPPRSKESIIEEVVNKYSTMSELVADTNLYMMVKRYHVYTEVSKRLRHHNRPKLTESDVKTAADKCTTLAEFMKEYPSEYQVARNNHWEHLTSHLTRTYKKTDELTYEHIWDCAHRCSGRTEFNKKYHSESYAAKKRGIYEELVADIPKHTWRPEHKASAPDYVKTSGQ
jgi:hypothetical protein